MIIAIVLAAGEGRRMGGTGKALIELDGRSFLERVFSTCRDGGCEDVVVVTRIGDSKTTVAANRLGAHTVFNPDPERGMFSSVQIGIQTALDGDPENGSSGNAVPVQGCLVFPVDHPRVSEKTVRTLIKKLDGATSDTFIQPTTMDRGGHPIALPLGAATRLLDL